MISTDKRREVAERLQGTALYGNGYDESDVGRLMSLAAMGECSEDGDL